MILGRASGALAATLVLGANAAAPSKLQMKNDFMAAMKQVPKEQSFKPTKHDKRARKERLKKNLLAKATRIDNKKPGAPEFMALKTGENLRRQLNQQGQNDWNNYYYYNNDVNWEEFGFDVSQMSIKFASCSRISMYSDEVAEAQDDEEWGEYSGGVTQMRDFVTFRLCPTSSCSENHMYGCDEYYGEYMLPLEDYLEQFQRYNEEQFEQLCDYCEQCMYFEKYFYGNRNLNEVDADADADAADADAYDADADAEEEESHACKYYDVCQDYATTCDRDDENDNNGNNNNNNNQNQNQNNDDYYQEFEIQELFECREVEQQNDDDQNQAPRYSVGPYCDANGGISIGIFYDQFCSIPAGDDVDIVEITGMQIDQDALANYYTSDCISCKESEQPYNLPEQDAEDDDEINELCEGLYQASAKCNTHIYEAEDISYLSYQQSDTNELVCEYINKVVTQDYSEDGMVILSNTQYETNLHASDASNEKVALWESVTLSLLGLGIMYMMYLACSFHRDLITYRGKNQPLVQSTESTDEVMLARGVGVGDKKGEMA